MKKSKLVELKRDSCVYAYGELEGFPVGHMDTDIPRWISLPATADPYSISEPNIYSEPFFVARLDDLPLYDERYRGYGAGDKALHYHYIHKLGLTSLVSPAFFVLHIPHKMTGWRDVTKHSEDSSFFQALEEL